MSTLMCPDLFKPAVYSKLAIESNLNHGAYQKDQRIIRRCSNGSSMFGQEIQNSNGRTVVRRDRSDPSIDQALDHSVDRSFDRSVDRSLIARSIVHRVIDRSLDRSFDRSIARSFARSVGRSLARSFDRSVARFDRSIHRSLARTEPGPKNSTVESLHAKPKNSCSPGSNPSDHRQPKSMR